MLLDKRELISLGPNTPTHARAYTPPTVAEGAMPDLPLDLSKGVAWEDVSEGAGGARLAAQASGLITSLAYCAR